MGRLTKENYVDIAYADWVDKPVQVSDRDFECEICDQVVGKGRLFIWVIRNLRICTICHLNVTKNLLTERYDDEIY